jgi:hypothetical protein
MPGRHFNVLTAAAFPGVRIVCGAAQCAGRHVGALRQKEDSSAAAQLDLPRPQPCNGADQRAFPGASLMVSIDALEKAETGEDLGRIERAEGEGPAELRLRDLSVTLDDGTAVVDEAQQPGLTF